MGGSQSVPTRKISIPNEESHIIKVSESVIERLSKCIDGTPEERMKKEAKSEECPPSAYQTNVWNEKPDPKYSGDALINYYYGPSLTSIRALQEKEKELKESESYWSRRIENMERNHEKLSQIMESEYNKAVLEVNCQTPRPPPDTPFPCCDKKDKLLECYTKNPKQILLCAGEVTEFSDCVHSQRVQAKRLQNCDKSENFEM